MIKKGDEDNNSRPVITKPNVKQLQSNQPNQRDNYMKKPDFLKAASVETPEMRGVKKTSSMEA